VTDGFDIELRERLARIASAVPVEPPALVGVVSSAPVRAGSTTRRLAIAGLVPLLVVGVVGTLLAGLAKVGPFAPGASATAGASEFSGQLLTTTRSGDFELTIRAAKGKYEAGEVIDIEATLAYLGRDPVVIYHAQGASVPGRGGVDGPDTGGRGGPIGFGIVEPVVGDFILSPIWETSCEATTLKPGEELAVPFEKNGAWSGNHPEYGAYLKDPVLRLPNGTWHVFADAEFSIGDCGADHVQMRAEITLDVAGASATASPPPSAEPTRWPVESTTRDGDFELTIRSAKGAYTDDEPIDVSATLTYLGPDESVTLYEVNLPTIFFSITPKQTVDLPMVIDPAICNPHVLERDTPLERALPDPRPIKPELGSSVGTWTIRAVATLFSASCTDIYPQLSTSITIVVIDDAAPAPTTGPGWSPSPVDSDGIVRAVARDDPFELRLEASSDSGFTANAPIDLSAWYAVGLRLEDSMTVSHFEPEMEFTISQVSDDARLIRSWVYDSSCQQVTLFDGLHRDVPLTDGAVTGITAATWPPSTADALEEGILQLPVGRWRITAGLQTTFGPCGAGGETRQLHASIVIDVVTAADAEIDLATGHVPTLENGMHACLTALGGGILALNPRTGLGFTDESGTAMTDVVWPDGYTARYEDGRAILLNDSGYLVAAVGDSMSLGGGYSGDNVFHVCGAGIAE
jgi:hypothetical protein